MHCPPLSPSLLQLLLGLLLPLLEDASVNQGLNHVLGQGRGDGQRDRGTDGERDARKSEEARGEARHLWECGVVTRPILYMLAESAHRPIEVKRRRTRRYIDMDHSVVQSRTYLGLALGRREVEPLPRRLLGMYAWRRRDIVMRTRHIDQRNGLIINAPLPSCHLNHPTEARTWW